MSKRSEDLHRAYRFAHNWAKARGAEQLTPDHLLLGMLLDAQGPAKELIKSTDISVVALWTDVEERLPASRAPANTTLTEDDKLKTFMLDAGKNKESITQLDLLLAFVEKGEGPGQVLIHHGLRGGHVQRKLATFEETLVEKLQQSGANLFLQEVNSSQRRLKEAQLLHQVHVVFLAIVAIVIGSGILLQLQLIPEALGVFLFVFFGWITSVSLHEYGHAIAAYMLGDDGILDKGYLTLNPILYAHGLLSILVPLVFLLLGGIGLPGGAVYVNHRALRDYRYSALVSGAGPVMTLMVTVVCLLPLWMINQGNINGVWPALGLLAFLNITALLINLLPIPGIDGFGIIQPWLPDSVQGSLLSLGRYGILILIVLFRLPGFSDLFWTSMFSIASIMGLDIRLFAIGFDLFQFWR